MEMLTVNNGLKCGMLWKHSGKDKTEHSHRSSNFQMPSHLEQNGCIALCDRSNSTHSMKGDHKIPAIDSLTVSRMRTAMRWTRLLEQNNTC